MKKYFSLFLCLLATSMMFSCGDDDISPDPQPIPQPQDEVSYYVYDIQYNEDFQTLLSIIGVKYNLYNGEDPSMAKTILKGGQTYKDSLLIDADHPYYVGVQAEGSPVVGLGGKTALDYPNSKDFREIVATYMYEECQKRGIDVVRLHPQAQINWFAQVVDPDYLHNSSSRMSLDITYDNAVKIAPVNASKEEVCKYLLASIRAIIIENRRINHWVPETHRFEKE